MQGQTPQHTPPGSGGDNPVLPISCNTHPPHPPAHLLPPLQGPSKPALLWHQLVTRIIRVWKEARAECSSRGGVAERAMATRQHPSSLPSSSGGSAVEMLCPRVSPRLGPLAPYEQTSSPAGKAWGNPCLQSDWRSEGQPGKSCASRIGGQGRGRSGDPEDGS